MSNRRSVFPGEQRLKVEAPELLPTMGRFLPRPSEISVQAPGSNSHSKPELPVSEISQETTKAQPVTTFTSTPSWTASVCKPPTVLILSSLPILQDLALPIPQSITRLAGRTALHLPAWEKITSNQWTLQGTSWSSKTNLSSLTGLR